VAVRTLWHEVIEARQAEAKTNGADSRECWVPADKAWATQLEDLLREVLASYWPDGGDPRATRIDLMAHLSAHIDAMDGKP
jgi:hypothetical protein